MPNVLLIYPKFPPSYWSCKYALQFKGRKAATPPLGLLTIAALFPAQYQLRLVDLNIETLRDEQLEWADIACISAMLIQRRSMEEVAERCANKGVRVITGGPYPSSFQNIQYADHVVAGEAELLLPQLITDLEQGSAKALYCTRPNETQQRRPDLSLTPKPRYDLVKRDAYHCMALQYSRGCPFNCEFCDITQLFGRVPRTKETPQMLEEFDMLYELGWRGPVFLVDDNFIGNRKQLNEFLPALAEWQQRHHFPFSLFTEASVNLAQHHDLMTGMRESGFNMVFLGIETPNPEALRATGKNQNVRPSEADYLLKAVRTVQQNGMEVTAGFILGLDGDNEQSFDAQIEFVQKAGIPAAMVGLLSALRGTDLYRRLEAEGRLCGESDGNNVECALNFIPQMDKDKLIEGYRRVLATLYQPSLRNYFDRCLTLFKQWRRTNPAAFRVTPSDLRAFALSLFKQILSRHGLSYIRFLISVSTRHTRFFPEAVRLAILGYHYQRITTEQLKIYDFHTFLAHQRHYAEELIARIGRARDLTALDLGERLEELYRRVQKRYRKIHRDFRESASDAVQSFSSTVESALVKYKSTDFAKP